LNWYVAKSKPRKEKYLIAGFMKWGVETFYPYIRQPGRPDRLEPLFSTYVFCRLDQSDPCWQAIRWTQGLSYFLNAGGKLSPVPASLIEYLKARTKVWNEGAYRKAFCPGETVVIVKGPFSGLEAVFQSYVPSRQRCQVLLQAVRGITSVELPEESVVEAEEAWRSRLATESA
jgi:transcriptional antiterminator RfaH